MSEAILILPNLRGGCVTVGNKVHTLFRLTSQTPATSDTQAPRHSAAPSGATGPQALSAPARKNP